MDKLTATERREKRETVVGHENFCGRERRETVAGRILELPEDFRPPRSLRGERAATTHLEDKRVLSSASTQVYKAPSRATLRPPKEREQLPALPLRALLGYRVIKKHKRVKERTLSKRAMAETQSSAAISQSPSVAEWSKATPPSPASSSTTSAASTSSPTSSLSTDQKVSFSARSISSAQAPRPLAATQKSGLERATSNAASSASPSSATGVNAKATNTTRANASHGGHANSSGGGTTVGGVDLSLEALAEHFHLPIADAAREIGVCATVLKKICRKYVPIHPTY